MKVEIFGNFNSALVYCKEQDLNADKQIRDICNLELYKNAKIRVMPDYHAGKGCVIGLTMKFTDVVNPELVGVDIGCGVRVSEIDSTFDENDFKKLDDVIRGGLSKSKYNSSGEKLIKNLKCFNNIKDNLNYFVSSIGTLGSGNHFIEVDRGLNTNYLVVHSGSRFLGVKVASYYSELFKSNSKDWFSDYLHDIELVQKYAEMNRLCLSESIIEKMKFKVNDVFESVHNYIDGDILRKGAISAKDGQRLIIPLNMRDGSIIGVGKGNSDWNYSAPHGAGRIMSRSEAKKSLSVDDFKNDMQGVYSSCISEKTLDESSFAYKASENITEIIGETVDIVEFVKPLYNFKS